VARPRVTARESPFLGCGGGNRPEQARHPVATGDHRLDQADRACLECHRPEQARHLVALVAPLLFPDAGNTKFDYLRVCVSALATESFLYNFHFHRIEADQVEIRPIDHHPLSPFVCTFL